MTIMEEYDGVEGFDNNRSCYAANGEQSYTLNIYLYRFF